MPHPVYTLRIGGRSLCIVKRSTELRGLVIPGRCVHIKVIVSLVSMRVWVGWRLSGSGEGKSIQIIRRKRELNRPSHK